MFSSVRFKFVYARLCSSAIRVGFKRTNINGREHVHMSIVLMNIKYIKIIYIFYINLDRNAVLCCIKLKNLQIFIVWVVCICSYLYNFDTNYWSAVYKHTVGKEYKVKAGYDSEVQLGWASIWVSVVKCSYTYYYYARQKP